MRQESFADELSRSWRIDKESRRERVCGIDRPDTEGSQKRSLLFGFDTIRLRVLLKSIGWRRANLTVFNRNPVAGFGISGQLMKLEVD